MILYKCTLFSFSKKAKSVGKTLCLFYLTRKLNKINTDDTINLLLNGQIGIEYTNANISQYSSGFIVSIGNKDKLIAFEADTNKHLWVRTKWMYGDWSEWIQLI